MTMPKILETEKLKLREFQTSDSEFVVRLLNSPGWLEHIGNRDIRTQEEAQIYLLTGPMNSYEKYGFGLYLVEMKETGESMGMCGLIKRDGLDDVDIGFAFLPEFCGKGYAYEAALATLVFAKKDLGMKRIVSITDMSNVRSINLLKRLGLVFEKKVKLPNEDKELLLFASSKVQPIQQGKK